MYSYVARGQVLTLWITLLLVQNTCVALDQADSPRAAREMSWQEFVAPFEEVFNKRQEHFRVIADRLIDQHIYRLNTGPSHLLMQKMEGDPWSPAPDLLSEQLLPHFRAINLHGVSVAGGVIQMGALGGFPEFNGNVMVLSIDYLSQGRKAEKLCETSTVESTPEGGSCLWPLGEPNWFARFIWIDQRDGSIWP